MQTARHAAVQARRAALEEGLSEAEAAHEAQQAFNRTKQRIQRSRAMKPPWPKSKRV